MALVFPFLIGLNEGLAALSHFIGAVGVCAADKSKPSDPRTGKARRRDRFDYKGFSRPEEYKRRWIEYAVTAGLLEVGILLGQGEKSLLLLLFIFIGNAAMQTIGWFNDSQLFELRGGGTKRSLFYSPTFNAFLILAAIVTVFVFHATNTIGKELKSLDFGYLALIFALFYSSFGVHQLLYMRYESYAKHIDIDRFYIVLGFTAKIVLSWTYISIERGAWDELGLPYDDIVPWENTDDSVASWNLVRLVLGFGSIVIIGLAAGMEYANICQKMCTCGEYETDTPRGGITFGRKRNYLYDNGPQEDDALLRKSKRRLNF